MGSPRGWGEHSPHPSGEPSPSRWPNKKERTR
nr:MAG TPA: ribosomal protein eL28 [Caudoviricetes sp.]